MVTQMSSEVETKLTTSFNKAFKRTEGEEPQPLEWRPFQGGGGPPGGGDGVGGPPGGPPGGPDPVPTGPNLPANLRPVPQARDIKAMGELPNVFNGD